MNLKRLPVIDAIQATEPKESVKVCGWIRTRRDAKDFSFLEINDGSCLQGLQVIVDADLPHYDLIKKATTGSSVWAKGNLVESKGKGQSWELIAKDFGIYGEAGSSYPLQKKGHSVEFLREIAHLRPRTNLFGAVFRVRSRLAYAVHQFFQDQGFFYVNTPIITASDCEGAGEMFQVSTLKPENLDGKPLNYEDDFFHKPTYLTVSGQLEGETFATALSKIYTFGPTFRAENSHTSRHASEFWMVEPEMAFCDLQEDMDLAEAFIKYLIQDVREHCASDLDFFNRFIDKTLLKRLQFVSEKPFVRLSYTDAIDILQASEKTFKYPVSFGANLQSEHERYLTEEHFKSPVSVYNYPQAIKPFYMKRNDDGKTVAAMDLLVPGIGEIIGGSQREENLDLLLENMKAQGLSEEDYWWYVDLRRFGSVPHSGFGLGFERMLMFVTGISNIRDVIPYPRTPGNADF